MASGWRGDGLPGFDCAGAPCINGPGRRDGVYDFVPVWIADANEHSVRRISGSAREQSEICRRPRPFAFFPTANRVSGSAPAGRVFGQL